MKETLFYVALLFLLDKALIRPSTIENKIKDVFVSYVGRVEEIKVDVELASFPRDLLGRIDKAEVRMRGFETETLPISITPKKVLAGKISRLKFEGFDLKYKDIPIKSVSLYLSDLRFNLPKLLFQRKMQFIGAGKGIVNLVLGEEALNEAAKEKAKVKLSDGRVELRFNVGYPPLSLPLVINGKLEGRGDKIFFVQPSGEVFSLPIPQSLLQYAVDRLNPILDISSLIPFTIPIKIRSIEIKEGEINISCEVDLSNLGKGEE
ncbi:MAG: DUF2993 domain-containing protein [bacterium]